MSVVFLFLSGALALPVPNQPTPGSANSTDTSGPQSGWVSGPNNRGTFDLLLGSLTTLSLCAWTAYHPNIHPKQGHVLTFFNRLWWMIVVVLAPELVLYLAWQQRWLSQKLCDDVNQIHESKPWLQKANGSDPADPPSKEDLAGAERTKWSIAHGFLALSGGIAVRTSSFYVQPQMTFTSDGIIELAKLGLLPEIALSDVEEKSKADGMGKVLVCVQAGWFTVQTIARAAQGLPITLLEVHVLAHVVCAFFMYFIWFKKPYDAQFPIYLTDERAVDIAALFIVDGAKSERFLPNTPGVRPLDSVLDIREVRASHLSGWNYWSTTGKLKKYWKKIFEKKVVVNLGQLSDDNWQAIPPTIDDKKIEEHYRRAMRAIQYFEELPDSRPATPSLHTASSSASDPITCSGALVRASQSTPSLYSQDSGDARNLPTSSSASIAESSRVKASSQPQRSTEPHGPLTDPSQGISNRLTESQLPTSQNSRAPTSGASSLSGITVSASSSWSITAPDVPRDRRTFHSPPHIVAVSHNRRVEKSKALFKSNQDFQDKLTKRQMWMFLLISCAYAGVHLSAWGWTDHFPTVVELWMWRASGLTIGIVPVLFFSVPGFSELEYRLRPKLASETKEASLSAMAPNMKRNISQSMLLALRWIMRKIVIFFLGVVGFGVIIPAGVYPVARLYVLVEVFYSLRAVPTGTYTTVEWTGFIPHAG